MTERPARGTVTCDLCEGRGWLFDGEDSKIGIELHRAVLNWNWKAWLAYAVALLPVAALYTALITRKLVVAAFVCSWLGSFACMFLSSKINYHTRRRSTTPEH